MDQYQFRELTAVARALVDAKEAEVDARLAEVAVRALAWPTTESVATWVRNFKREMK